MTLVVALVFLALALVAAAFVAWPIIRRRSDDRRRRAVLAAAAALLVFGIGGGSYLLLGQPDLAARALEGDSTRNLNGLVALLARRVVETPGDARGWTLLGRAYLTAGDPDEAAKALAHAINVERTQGTPSPGLLSAYGEALVQSASGTVTPEAETAFKAALAGDPKDMASRFYLGLAYAARGENAQALSLWRSLLADAPPDAPWRRELVDRMATLAARSGKAPNIVAMVQGLADRLKSHPDDAQGWMRLVRAYVVLGQAEKAKSALADARKALAHEPDALKALNAEAADLNLQAKE